MQQIKLSNLSSNKTNTNSSTKKRDTKMAKKLSSEEKARLTYQADERKTKNLNQKILKQEQIIRSKQKLVQRKKNGVIVTVLKQLTPAEQARERMTLEKLKSDYATAKNSLKYSRFDYKKVNQKSSSKYRGMRSSLAEKNRAKIFSKAVRLTAHGKKNGSLDKLKVISSNLGSKSYTDQQFKKDILPILNKYNNGFPITSLSKEAIAELKTLIKDIK